MHNNQNDSLLRLLARPLVLATLVGVLGQFAMATEAYAKHPKCTSTPLAGQPGTYIWTCTTTRP